MTTALSPRVAALLGKMQANRARLIFCLDATASRQPMWDMAAQLQSQMFEEAAKIGDLAVQLVHYGGDEFRHTPWLSDAHELVGEMHKIRCTAGATQIGRTLAHIKSENEREKVNGAVLVSDACEEFQGALYEAARDLS